MNAYSNGLYKSLIVLLSLVAGTYSVKAQQTEPKTLFPALVNQPSGHFWAIETGAHHLSSRFREYATPILGLTYARIINQSFLLGVGGKGKIGRTTFYADDTYTKPGQLCAVGYGYGGILIGYIHRSYEAIHWTIPVLIGLGSSNEYEIGPRGEHSTTFNSPTFPVIEPAIHLELNLLTKTRLELGFGYRFIGTRRFQQIGPEQLNGLTFQLLLKQGKF